MNREQLYQEAFNIFNCELDKFLGKEDDFNLSRMEQVIKLLQKAVALEKEATALDAVFQQ